MIRREWPTNDQKNKERKREKPILSGVGEQGTEQRRRGRAEEELYRVLLLSSFTDDGDSKSQWQRQKDRDRRRRGGRREGEGKNTYRHTHRHTLIEKDRHKTRERRFGRKRKKHLYERQTKKEGQQDGQTVAAWQTPPTQYIHIQILLPTSISYLHTSYICY